jgi:hypothetical protein
MILAARPLVMYFIRAAERRATVNATANLPMRLTRRGRMASLWEAELKTEIPSLTLEVELVA